MFPSNHFSRELSASREVMRYQPFPPNYRDLQDGEQSTRVRLFLLPARWSECPPTRSLSVSQSHDQPPLHRLSSSPSNDKPALQPGRPNSLVLRNRKWRILRMPRDEAPLCESTSRLRFRIAGLRVCFLRRPRWEASHGYGRCRLLQPRCPNLGRVNPSSMTQAPSRIFRNSVALHYFPAVALWAFMRGENRALVLSISSVIPVARGSLCSRFRSVSSPYFTVSC